MDVMELRRGLLMQMASGAEFIKGSFTVPDSGSSYVLNFGKSFSKYLLLVEADDESKDQIVNSGYSGARTFCYVMIFPKRTINNINVNPESYTAYYNPSTESLNATATANTMTENSATFAIVGLSDSGSYRLYRGLTYNYYVVEIK